MGTSTAQCADARRRKIRGNPVTATGLESWGAAIHATEQPIVFFQ
jgi:hypothetical protein